MPLPLDLQFRLNRDEWIEVVRRGAWKHPFVRVAAGFTVFLGGAGYWAGSSRDYRGLAIIAWTAAVMGLWYLIQTLLVAPRRSYDRCSPALRDGVLHYRITTTGIELKTETFQGRWDWSLFRLYAEEPSWFVVYPVSTGSCFLLPKRAIPGPEAVTELRDLLASKLKVW